MSSPRQALPLACAAVRSWLSTHHRSHEWLAREIGVGVNTVSRWLSGRRLPWSKYRAQIEKLTDGVVTDRMWFLTEAGDVCHSEPNAVAQAGAAL